MDYPEKEGVITYTGATFSVGQKKTDLIGTSGEVSC